MLIVLRNTILMNSSSLYPNRSWTELRVPAADGELRMLHHRPPGQTAALPVFFIPGWGTLPEGFTGFLRGVEGRTECFYFETREKNSSRLHRRAGFSMDQHVRDLTAALEAAGLADGAPFVLAATCWGASVAASAAASVARPGTAAPPRLLLFDPMERLWFPRWILDFLLPVVPLALWRLIRPLGKAVALWGMKETVQRGRISAFIDAAELWKWKKAARAVRDFSFSRIAPAVPGEVWVVNGVRDKVHDASLYPRLAAALPGGRFLHIPSGEALREQLIASVSLAFALHGERPGPPPELASFELPLRS